MITNLQPQKHSYKDAGSRHNSRCMPTQSSSARLGPHSPPILKMFPYPHQVGDIVLCPGKWANQDMVGLVEATQFVDNRMSWNVDVRLGILPLALLPPPPSPSCVNDYIIFPFIPQL